MTGLYAEGNRSSTMEGSSRDIRKDYYASRSNRRQIQQQYRLGEPSSLYGGPQHEPRAAVSPSSMGIPKKPGRSTGMEHQRYASRAPTPNQRPSTPSDFPFIFGDPMDNGSVQTGSSQQELLRKKARTESKKRQKKFSKKRKEPKIVNMPPSLVSSNTTKNTNTDRSPRPADYRKQNEKKWEKTATISSGRWPISSPSSADEKESLTVESTVTDSNASTNQRHYDTPYSTVALPAAVVKNEFQSEGWEDERKEDSGSVSEFSFPLLSTQATGARREERSQMTTASDEQDQSTQSSGSARRRNVRFSERLEQSTIFLAENRADYPLKTTNPGHVNAKDSNFSPTSVLDHPDASASQTLLYPPKSILRDSKYTRQKRNATPIDSRDPTYLRAYIDNANAALYGGGGSSTVQRGQESTQAYSSPNRAEYEARNNQSEGSEPLFFDNAGAELSPIRPGNISFQDETQKEFLAQDGHQLQQRTPVAQTTAETFGGSSYPSHNDEGSVASRMAFIEAVAAVVIQTAFRRHVARQIVAVMRESKQQRIVEKAQPPTAQTKSSASQADRERKARRVFDRAAVIIQAIFRGFWTRDCLNVDRYCATAIQRVFRGYHCRLNYQFDLYRIILIQSVWRRSIAREQVSFLLAYIIVIQSAIRRFLSQRALRRKQVDVVFSARENAAATIIQAKWRMHSCWSRYTELLFTLIIQSAVRGWLGRRKAAQLRAAKKAASVNNARRRMTHRANLMRRQNFTTVDRPLQESSMRPNVQGAQSSNGPSMGSSALSRKLPAPQSKQKSQRAVVASNPIHYEGGPFNDEFDSLHEQNTDERVSEVKAESEQSRLDHTNARTAWKTGRSDDDRRVSDYSHAAAPPSNDSNKETTRDVSAVEHSAKRGMGRTHGHSRPGAYFGRVSSQSQIHKKPSFDSFDSKPKERAVQYGGPSTNPSFDSYDSKQNEIPNPSYDNSSGPTPNENSTAYEVPASNDGPGAQPRESSTRYGGPRPPNPSHDSYDGKPMPTSTRYGRPPTNPSRDSYDDKPKPASTSYGADGSYDDRPKESSTRFGATPSDANPSYDSFDDAPSKTRAETPSLAPSHGTAVNVHGARPALFDDESYGWAYERWAKKGLLDIPALNGLELNNASSTRERMDLAIRQNDHPPAQQSLTREASTWNDHPPDRQNDEVNYSRRVSHQSEMNDRQVETDESDVMEERAGGAVKHWGAATKPSTRNKFAGADVSSRRSPSARHKSFAQPRHLSKDQTVQLASTDTLQYDNGGENREALAVPDSEMRDVPPLPRTGGKGDNVRATFVRKAAPELSGDASQWKKERSTEHLPKIDKSNDPYSWAYSIWASKGFLEWEPSS